MDPALEVGDQGRDGGPAGDMERLLGGVARGRRLEVLHQRAHRVLAGLARPRHGGDLAERVGDLLAIRLAAGGELLGERVDRVDRAEQAERADRRGPHVLVGIVHQPDQRRHRRRIAELADRADRRAAGLGRGVAEPRDQRDHRAAIAELLELRDRRDPHVGLVVLEPRDQRDDHAAGAAPADRAERLDRVHAHRGVGVAERAGQRGGRLGAADIAEHVGGDLLDLQIGIGEPLDHRRDRRDQAPPRPSTLAAATRTASSSSPSARHQVRLGQRDVVVAEHGDRVAALLRIVARQAFGVELDVAGPLEVGHGGARGGGDQREAEQDHS